MVRFENDCVGCPQGCVDCGKRRAAHFYCDVCETEQDKGDLFWVDGEMLCRYCLLERHRRVSEVDWTSE